MWHVELVFSLFLFWLRRAQRDLGWAGEGSQKRLGGNSRGGGPQAMLRLICTTTLNSLRFTPYTIISNQFACYLFLPCDVYEGNATEADIRTTLSVWNGGSENANKVLKNKINLAILFSFFLPDIWRDIVLCLSWRHSSLLGNVRSTKVEGNCCCFCQFCWCCYCCCGCCCCRRSTATSCYLSSATGWRTCSVPTTASCHSKVTSLEKTSVKMISCMERCFY